MSIERIREVMEPLLEPEERYTFEVWENENGKVYEIAIGLCAGFLNHERLEGLEKTNKLEEWCEGFLDRYRRRHYEAAPFNRRDLAFATYRTLMEMMGQLPQPWIEAAFRKITMAMADEIPGADVAGDTQKLSLPLLMRRNQFILEHLVSLMVPKKKEAEMKTVA